MTEVTELETHKSAGAMGAKLLPFSSIPVVDIGPLLGNDESARLATGREIAEAATTVGFFYIRNHGVPEKLIDRAYERSRQFHNSPPETKDRVHVRHSPGTRGWIPDSFQESDPDPELYRLVPPKDPEHDHLTKPRLHGAFDLALELTEDDPDFVAGNIMLVPNQWPDWIPGFREDIVAYYEAVIALGDQLMRSFAISLDLPEMFFVERTRKPPSQLRLLHYPQNDRPMDNMHLGIGAHSDFELFTILHTGGPGLQVMNAADEWVEAPPIPGAFIVNIGDMLEAYTNGLFKATQHRVVNTGQERYSIPLFFSADYYTVVEPLAQFVSPQNPPRYGSIVAGDHLAGFSIQLCKHLRKRVLSGDLKVDFPFHSENPFKRKAVNEYA